LQRGDFDGDDEITVLDAQGVLAVFVESLVTGWTNMTEEQKRACDIDHDGQITVSDAQYILLYYTENYVAGNPTKWHDLVK
jgi:hypothetical protein